MKFSKLILQLLEPLTGCNLNNSPIILSHQRETSFKRGFASFPIINCHDVVVAVVDTNSDWQLLHSDISCMQIIKLR